MILIKKFSDGNTLSDKEKAADMQCLQFQHHQDLQLQCVPVQNYKAQN